MIVKYMQCHYKIFSVKILTAVTARNKDCSGVPPPCFGCMHAHSNLFDLAIASYIAIRPAKGTESLRGAS